MKLFVTGLSGMLGLNLGLQGRQRFDVSGCHHTHPIAIDDLTSIPLDLIDVDQTAAAIRDAEPDVIAHTAGLTNVEACEQDPELAQKLNTDVARQVAEVAAEVGARLIHISTDHLFDGERPWSHEDDSPTPLNAYARSKLDAERAVLGAHADTIVVRTNFYGWGPPHRASLSDWILESLAQADTLNMFRDVFFTPILVNDLSDLIFQLAGHDVTGVLNVAGGERLSKYEFAIKLAETFGYATDCVQAVSVERFPFTAPRPRDMSLDTTRMHDVLGVQGPALAPGLDRLAALKDEGWPDLVNAAATSTIASERSA